MGFSITIIFVTCTIQIVNQNQIVHMVEHYVMKLTLKITGLSFVVSKKLISQIAPFLSP